MKIRVLTTGGTIDGFDAKQAKNPGGSLIPGLLKLARVTQEYAVEEVVAKDSKLITDEDREKIYEKCAECEEKNIVITHGTDTMAETAKYLGGKEIPKTIVVCGAAVPASETNSDALFNLGAAFTAAQTLPQGVYVSMNGRIFGHDNVKKNFAKGVFETQS